ncbi:MAG TPA: family 10 glycosylhydrolase [Candidatus Omnitrophota bacterium]|mgnify:CR=1 FL=1|nr:family 10 glycosylhydrolase [Candidatus Omnitrophota bacterium]HPS37136.1 family 10 glycosylhydrolase [Candidatus Omnitrophota bacterium]
MRKSALCCLLAGIFLFQTSARSGEVFRRGLFVSVIQTPPVLSSRDAIRKLIDFSKKAKVQVLFVQLYYANKAWFLSTVGDTSPYQTCLKSIGEDPTALLIREAHAAGIEVHAWLNMCSLNNNVAAPLLKKYGPEILTQDLSPKRSLQDYKIDNQFFLEPGDPRVRRELVTVVGEVLQAYPDLDGIQLDYIRYPDNHPVYGYGRANVERYQKTTGVLTIANSDPAWQTWKRRQVTELLEQLVKSARGIRPGLRVSATGCMPYARARHEAFQDWPSWIDRGIVDFITLMNYSPEPAQFERWNKQAKSKTIFAAKVNVGVGAYKLVQSPEVFSKEYRDCEDSAEGGACVVFHYGSLVEAPELAVPLLTDR